MKTANCTISYIVVHMILPGQWDRMTYRRKKEYHHLVTSMGKKISLRPLQLPATCIDVAFVGPERTVRDSGALHILLQKLGAVYPAAEIIYAETLQERSGPSPILTLARRLTEHLPAWFQRALLRCHSLFTLRSLLPIV